MISTSGQLDWISDGQIWPHRQLSRFVRSGGYDWHVQIAGPDTAPAMVLLHGTGAASHSWRGLIPLLSDHFRVIVPDLPCHGFTRADGLADLSLDGMAISLAGLFRRIGVDPKVIVGHSAGAAIAAVLGSGRHAIAPRQLVAINGAFLPIRGNRLLSPMARALFANPFSAAMFSALSKLTPLGNNLLDSTHSAIDANGKDVYQMLLASSAHVRGALGMMASWNLDRMDAVLEKLAMPVLFVATRDDPMVPCGNSVHADRITPHGHLDLIERGGHLLHESQPDMMAGLIAAACKQGLGTGVDAA